jgi:catechol 2,3-dioxygenase-like lactoylglutathione lyase family enzyme
MLDHIILSVSDVERSLAFYEAALKPLNIKFFLPYKGEGDHPDLWGFGDGRKAFFWIKQGKPNPASIHWGFMAENKDKIGEFYRRQFPLVQGTIFHRGHQWNTIRDTMPPMYLTRTGIRLRSSTKVSDGMRPDFLDFVFLYDVDAPGVSPKLRLPLFS